DWSRLEAGTGVELLAKGWHRRKLRRGVHQANKFSLVLRDLDANNSALEKRLRAVREEGVPNYFGEQRFGRNGSTLRQAREWMRRGRRVSRDRRSLYLSALRAWVFNGVLAERVRQGDWNLVRPGDRCMLRGSRSHFGCDTVTEDIVSRAAAGDLSPGLPLWGQVSDDGGKLLTGMNEEARAVCEFLTEAGLTLAWRSTRLLPDDFSWQFCDDGSLHLGFDLVAGGYATALLAECLLYKNGAVKEH
ncbi:MAG: tRNA pseudouridine(13) synthase TruD, partial [Proteobacteria bacterium]|nr:tRNA pseudouridine(13) synthase TruD [Pseudomonadota bacterium]